MSVYKALRGDSPVQFVETARKLAVFTRKNCLKMPKRYTFYGAQELSALADAVYNEVKMANSIFPGNQADAQLRRNHLTEANAALQALVGQLGIMADLLKQTHVARQRARRVGDYDNRRSKANLRRKEIRQGALQKAPLNDTRVTL